MVVSLGGAVVGGGNMSSNFFMWASPCLSLMNVFIPSIHCPSLAETPGPGAENEITLIFYRFGYKINHIPRQFLNVTYNPSKNVFKRTTYPHFDRNRFCDM